MDNIATTLVSSATAIVAIAALLWSQFQQRESWLHLIKEIHADFWKDQDMIEVRAWLANDDAYQVIQPILKKRSDAILGRPTSPLSADEYKRVIDKLDKFLHLMYRVIEINPNHSRQERIMYDLFAFWIDRLGANERKEIRVYAQYCFPLLMEFQWKHKVKEPA